MAEKSDNNCAAGAGIQYGPYGRGDKLPRHLDQVTPEWLSAVLQNRYPGLKVQSMETLDLRNGHTTKLRLKLDLNDVGQAAGISSQVCLKSNWSEGFDSGDICELEARFYHDIRKDLTIPVPNSYYADWDGDGSGQGLVVMEDLIAEGGTFGHSTHHIGIDGVAHGLEGLARLHGAWWDSDKLNDSSWLQTSMATPVDTEQLRMMWPYAEHNLAREGHQKILPQWLLDDPQRLSRAYDLLAAYERSQPGPYCIVHGDSHLGNSYLRPNGERVWLDWQLVRRGRPWRDVTYFMLGSLTIEERRSAERDLIHHYCQALKSTGAEGVLSDEDAWQQYRRWPLYGMQSWLANMDEWGQTGLPMVERFYQAAEDLDSLKLLES